MSKKLSIVIPVHNEPENIEKTLNKINATIDCEKEIIVIYDKDNDTTLDVLKKIKPFHENLIIKKNSVHPGPSGALITGFSEVNYDHTLVMMADLCDDISIVDNIMNEFAHKYDVISFSRFSDGGSAILNKPEQRFNRAFFKHYLKIFLPKIASFFLQNFGGLILKDPTNSFKLYSTQLLKKINLKSTISFSVTLEIVMKAKAMGYRLYEVPTIWTDREFGKTNFPLIRSLKSYLPWFLIILINNRLFSFPKDFFKTRFLK